MNLIKLNRALHQLRLGGMVAVLETSLLQAQTDNMAPIDLFSDEIDCRSKRLLERLNGATNKRSPATPTSNWTTSTSSSTPR
jgi:hypothetical protein